MNTKYLIALFLLIAGVTAQGSASISLSDSEQFVESTFYNFIAVPNVIMGQTISFNFQFNRAPSDIEVYFYKQNTAAANMKPCPALPSTCTLSWDGTVTSTSGNYWITMKFATAGDNTLVTGKYITVGSVTVSGNAGSRANSTILKQTAVVSAYRLHKVYFAAQTNINVVLPYTDPAQAALYQLTDVIQVFNEDQTTNQLTKITATNTNDDTATKTVTWTFTVSANFSWIAFDPSGLGITWTSPPTYPFRLNYNTQVYTCPYIAEYPDTTGYYKGCVFQADLSRLPCIIFNTTSGACQVCYTGYSLDTTTGKCVEQPCPAGQYKRYGQCLQNPVGCDTYNQFTKCTKCSTGYLLANGVCSRAPLNCTGRTFFNSATFTCDKVDDKCKEWSANTGACTSCISAVQKVVAGKCVPAEQTCNERQYVNAVLDCVDIDPLCQTFEKFGGKCIKCVWGYDYNATQAKCIKVICPNRFVPNDYAKCVRVSDLCDEYDARGNCLACIPTHALQLNGICLQIQKPNPCPPRQYLARDNYCREVDEFCEIFNKDNGICSKCINNYFLMYTGQCVLKKQCKFRQFLIDNDCYDVSPTCGNYDRNNGKCLNCASEDYELYYGLCIPKTTCGVRQWTDNNGKCNDVNPRCNTFNPSTGDCSSCVQGYNYVNGICCLKGQFNSNGKCVNAADASQVSSSDGCRTFQSGIGCIRCDDGFVRTQDNFGFYFCKSL